LFVIDKVIRSFTVPFLVHADFVIISEYICFIDISDKSFITRLLTEFSDTKIDIGLEMADERAPIRLLLLWCRISETT
jgi:hypothetical protein